MRGGEIGATLLAFVIPLGSGIGSAAILAALALDSAVPPARANEAAGKAKTTTKTIFVAAFDIGDLH